MSGRVQPSTEAETSVRRLWSRAAVWGLLGMAVALFALHYLHLSADFPRGTPWMDWAKYTDEGWYGAAAVRFLTAGGHWFVPGDFNPAVALPVWPVLEGLLFRVTGVGIVPARALSVSCFGGAAMCAAVLVRRALAGMPGRRSAVPAVAASGLLAVTAASPFLYAFSRMAILEPLVLLVGFGALLAGSRVRPERWVHGALVVGALLPVLVLTKTTALFLVPSIAWMLWARAGYGLRGVRAVALAGTIGAGLWGAYFGLVVRPHFLEDYRYLFSANGYTGITRATAWAVIGDAVRDVRWVGPALAVAALVASALGAALVRRLRREPLFASLLLWVMGYLTFLAYHNNLQPRYYLMIALPLLTLLVLSLGALWKTGAGGGRVLAVVGVAVVAWASVVGARTMVRYARSPEYSFLAAAREVARMVRADPEHSQLLLSVSGADISLMTGLPSICDDFGTLELDDRIELYRPGWYAAWNYVEDDKMDAIAPLYHAERVAAFPAYDDPERNLLILYRLETPGEHRRARRRAGVPRRLRTRSGQQPSAVQLVH